MRDYVICTDSGCDVDRETLSSWGVVSTPLSFLFEDGAASMHDGDMPAYQFYAKMREGKKSTTSAVNVEEFKSEFKKILDTDRDILYIGFSSALSSTFNAARAARDELLREYPEKKILTVDSLAASAGLGLAVYLTSEKKGKGASIEEAELFATEISKKICHWFTVDDLNYLKKGGRISASSAFFGNMLSLKPVLHVNRQGELKAKMKAIGRRSSIDALVRKYGEEADPNKDDAVFISHGDCYDDAKLLEKLLYDTYGTEVLMISNVGSVIGSHSGPGTLALFFIGKQNGRGEA